MRVQCSAGCALPGVPIQAILELRVTALPEGRGGHAGLFRQGCVAASGGHFSRGLPRIRALMPPGRHHTKGSPLMVRSFNMDV